MLIVTLLFILYEITSELWDRCHWKVQVSWNCLSLRDWVDCNTRGALLPGFNFSVLKLSCLCKMDINMQLLNKWYITAYYKTFLQLFCVVLCIVRFVSFYVLFLFKCVLYCCHLVTTQLKLTNISYHII